MNTPYLTRRQLLISAAAAAALPTGASAQSQGEAIRIGQSLALSGPLAELGKAMLEGAHACFAAVNAKGGVNGRPIELIGRDDGYDVKRAVANVQGFMADNTFALFSCMGTPMIEAMLPMIKGTNMPLFAPATGATSARPRDMRNVMNIRASYAEETERLIEHLATIRIPRVAIVAQNNSFGAEVAQAAQAAATRRGLSVVSAVKVQNDSSDAASAAAAVAAAKPEAVFIGLAGKPTIGFVQAIRRARPGLPLYALSVLGGGMLGALKDDAYGVAITQVVPLPNNQVVPVVRDFHRAWAARGTALAPSHLALEGYINARVFAEALRLAGPKPTREHFVDAVYGLKQLNLGGFEVGFTGPGRNASRFIELTMVGRNGRFVR